MAKSSKKKTNKTQSEKVETVDSSELPDQVDAIPDETATFDDPNGIELVDDALIEDIASEDTPQDEIPSAEEDIPESSSSVTDPPEYDDLSEPEAEPVATQDTVAAEDDVTEPVVQPPTTTEPSAKSGGFIPMLLGGVAAGAIGYAFALYGLQDDGEDLAALVSAQAGQIATLESQLADVPAAPDLSGVEGQITDVNEKINSQNEAISGLGEDLTALDARLLEVEKRPGADGTLSDTALAAYQRELEELRSELDSQKDDVMSAAAQAEADLAAARAQAERMEQAAIEQAEAAAARAALSNIATAVETGAPFADALESLNLEVPAALKEASEDGVATAAELTNDFPAAARAALATARSEGLTDDAGGLGGFLRSQLDIRSTTPQEGPGTDAVLSRAEAAVEGGRIAEALAEIEALPEVARAEMTDWMARAHQRADVLDAIASLSETLN